MTTERQANLVEYLKRVDAMSEEELGVVARCTWPGEDRFELGLACEENNGRVPSDYVAKPTDTGKTFLAPLGPWFFDLFAVEFGYGHEETLRLMQRYYWADNLRDKETMEQRIREWDEAEIKRIAAQ